MGVPAGEEKGWRGEGDTSQISVREGYEVNTPEATSCPCMSTPSTSPIGGGTDWGRGGSI